MTILTLEQLLEIHALVIQATGGENGLRDLGRLEAAIATQTQNVFGKELYPEVIDKAAALIRGIIGDHAFIDGNKRTAMLAGLTLLEMNRVKFEAESGEIEKFAIRVAVERLDVPEIIRWISVHVSTSSQELL